MSEAILLISSSTTTTTQELSQRRAADLLTAKKCRHSTLDGALPESKELRDVLFGVSSLRGKYPQLFIKNEDGSYVFVGDWERMEALAETDDLDAAVLEANPSIETFSKIMGCTMQP